MGLFSIYFLSQWQYGAAGNHYDDCRGFMIYENLDGIGSFLFSPACWFVSWYGQSSAAIQPMDIEVNQDSRPTEQSDWAEKRASLMGIKKMLTRFPSSFLKKQQLLWSLSWIRQNNASSPSGMWIRKYQSGRTWCQGLQLWRLIQYFALSSKVSISLRIPYQ